MSLFLAVGSHTFDGAEYVQVTTSYGEAWNYYPCGRQTPADVWANLQNVIGLYTDFFFTISYEKKLQIMHWGGSGTYTINFKDAAGANSATVAGRYGFSSATVTASAGATTTAHTAISAYEMTHLNPRFVDTSSHTAGHGAGAGARSTRAMEIEAYGSRSNVAGLVTAIEQNNYVSVATSDGPLSWTMAVGSCKVEGAGLTSARVALSGVGRI